MKKLIPILCLAAMWGAALRADNWCQWMADANTILGYANVKAIRAVPLMTELINGNDNVSRFTAAVNEWTAVDLDSVTDAWFGVAGQDDALFVLQGTFNLAIIRGRLGAIEKFRVETPANAEFTVTMPDDKKPGKLNTAAFLSPTVVAFGPPPQVEAFLGNLAQKRKHAQAADFAMLEKPSHMVECVVLKFPNKDGKTPRFIVENTRRLHLGIDCDDVIAAQLTVQPVKPEMVDPLARIGTGLVDMIHLLPPDQIPLQGPRRMILDNATVTATKEAIVLASSLPVDQVRPMIARKITPAQRPAPGAQAAPATQPAPGAQAAPATQPAPAQPAATTP